jgi:hypothetical protein
MALLRRGKGKWRSERDVTERAAPRGTGPVERSSEKTEEKDASAKQREQRRHKRSAPVAGALGWRREWKMKLQKRLLHRLVRATSTSRSLCASYTSDCMCSGSLHGPAAVRRNPRESASGRPEH